MANPLDVLVLMDEPAFPGRLVHARLIGVIEAEQFEGGRAAERNDRLISIAQKSSAYSGVRTMKQLGGIVDEIEQFFVSYNALAGKRFKPIGRGGRSRALETVRTALLDQSASAENNDRLERAHKAARRKSR